MQKKAQEKVEANIIYYVLITAAVAVILYLFTQIIRKSG